MQKYNLIATCVYGLEKVLKFEIMGLGYKADKVEDGRVYFQGDALAVARANIFLRTAGRVFILLKEFQSTDFEEYFQAIKAIDWASYIPLDGKIHVTGSSVKSGLSSVPTCQAVAKKSIIESMKEFYKCDTFPETGVRYKVHVSLKKDLVQINLDTSIDGLHRRGYRANRAGEAPLRETIAAGLVLLSRWRSDFYLVDPFCGSGTILIEAALIGRDIAPGINRKFGSEGWFFLPEDVWASARQEARDKVNNKDFKIFGYDLDERVLKSARDNAAAAGVADNIDFHQRSIADFSSQMDKGNVITNPPYGERMGDEGEVHQLYIDLHNAFKHLPHWSFYVYTGYEEYNKVFWEKPDNRRKLFNANIKCYLHQYFKRRDQ